MRQVYERCAGLDVHKKSVVACRAQVVAEGQWVTETKTFGTMTRELLTLLDWLQEWAVTHVAMESTGDYWKPVFNLLEGNLTVLLVNAQHVKHVPGRKTAPNGHPQDAEWLAELLSHGLLKASFIPSQPQRVLRDLTRYRTNLIEERSRTINRVQKLLEGANIKLAAVASDILGVSGRRMLEALVTGKANPTEMAELAKGRLRTKIPTLQAALTGIVSAHQRFLLAQQLAHIDFLDEQIEQLGDEIARQLGQMSQTIASDVPPDSSPGAPIALTWQTALGLLDTAPGISRRTAEVILAEIGIDMRQFPSAAHLAAWAGLAPGNHQSANRRYAVRRRDGNPAVRASLVQAAWVAVRMKNAYLAALYRRLAQRRGKKRAILAVAHSLLRSVYFMLTRQQPYHDLGPDYFDQRDKHAKADRLLRQLHQLGYAVQAMPLPVA